MTIKHISNYKGQQMVLLCCVLLCSISPCRVAHLIFNLINIVKVLKLYDKALTWLTRSTLTIRANGEEMKVQITNQSEETTRTTLSGQEKHLESGCVCVYLKQEIQHAPFCCPRQASLWPLKGALPAIHVTAAVIDFIRTLLMNFLWRIRSRLASALRRRGNRWCCCWCFGPCVNYDTYFSILINISLFPVIGHNIFGNYKESQ